MKIPSYSQQYLPTAATGTPKSLAGEKHTAMSIPNTEAAIYNSIKQTGDKLFDIGTSIAKAEDITEYNDAVVKLKEGYSAIKNDLATNPEYNNYSVKEFEDKNTEMSTQLQTTVMGGLTKYNAKKQTSLTAREMGVTSRVAAQAVGHAKYIDRSRASAIKNLEVYGDSFMKSGNPKDLTLAESVITSSVAAGIFSKQEGVTIARKFKDGAISGYYENQINENSIALYNQVITNKTPPATWDDLSEEYQTKLEAKLVAKYEKDVTETKIAQIGTWENQSVDYPIKAWADFNKTKRSDFELLDNREYARLKKTLKSAHKAATTKTATMDPVLANRMREKGEDILAQVEETGVSTLKPFLYELEKTFTGVKDGKRKFQAEKEKFISDYALAGSKHGVKKSIQNGNPTENKAFVDSMKKGISKEVRTDLGIYDAIGPADSKILHNQAIKEYNYKMDKLSTDPKALFDEYYPTLAPSSADPATRITENNKYIDRLTDFYTAQGLPKSMWKVMSKDEASTYSDSIIQKPTSGIINDIINIQKGYGKNANLAFRDLSAEGFPTELRLIAELKKPNGDPDESKLKTIGRDLADAYKLKEVDFAKAMGVEAKDIRMDINEKINTDDEISNFEASVYATGTTSNNIKKVADIKNAVRKLSYIYKMRGMTEKKAVTKASKAVLGGKFNYVESNDMTVRVPTKYDKSIVNKAMKITLNNLDLRSTMKSTAYWKNVGGNEDLSILVTGDGIPINDRNNNPVTINFDNAGDIVTKKVNKSKVYKIPKRGK
jgi:hypothetical protein